MFLYTLIFCVLCFSLSVRAVLYFAFGLYLGVFNPLRGEFNRVVYKNKFHIKGIQIYPWRKKVVVSHIKVYPSVTDIKPPSKDSSEKKRVVPQWIQDKFSLITRCLDNVNIVFSKIEVAHLDLAITDFVIEVEACSKTNELGLKTFVRTLRWQEQLLNKESLYNFTAVLDFEKLYNAQFPLKDVVVDLKIGMLRLPMESIMKSGIASSPKDATQPPSTETKKTAVEECEEDIDTLLESVVAKMNTICDLTESLKQFNINIDELLVEKYASTTNKKLIELNKYLSYNLFVSNFTLDLSRYIKIMPGYKLYFRDTDTPFKYTTTLSRLNICVNLGCKSGSTEQIKVFELPSLSLYGESNMLSQRFLFNKGETLENAVFNLKGNISSPTVDIDIMHISFIKSFLENYKVFNQSFSDPVVVTGCTKSKFSRNRDIFTTFFKSFFPLFNIKLSLEDTKIAITDGSDLALLRVSAMIMNFRSQRKTVETVEKTDRLYFETSKSFELLDLSVVHKIKDTNYVCKILGMDTINLHEHNKMEPTELLSVLGGLETLSVDLSELPTMVMLNKVIRKIDCQIVDVEENFFKPFYEKFATMIKSSENSCSIIADKLEQSLISPKDFIFLPLPDYFDYVKFDIRNLKIVLGSRSVFMPPDVFSSTESQSAYDLINGKLRKLLLEMDKLQIALCGSQTQWKTQIESGRVNLVQTGDSSEYRSYGRDSLDDISTSESTEVSYPWTVNVLVNSIVSTVIGEAPDDSLELTKRTVFKLSIFSLKAYPETEGFAMSEEPRIIVNVSNQKLKTLFCLNNIFLAISGVHTLHQIFGKRAQVTKRESWAKQYFMNIAKTKRKSKMRLVDWSKMKDLVKFNFGVDEFQQLMFMPNGLRTRFEILNLTNTFEDMSNIQINGEYFRMCIQSPTDPELWERFVVINRFKILTDVPALKAQMSADFIPTTTSAPGIVLENESWHFNVPHNFAIYNLIDNFSTIFKSIKQMMHSFKTSQNDLIIFPHAVKVPSLPMIKLLSKRYILSIDDDPFEAKMNTVFQIGLAEQRARISKWNRFNSEMRQALEKKEKVDVPEEISELINRRKIVRQRRLESNTKAGKSYVFSDSCDSKLLEVIPESFERAYDKLQENISTSWIRRIQVHRNKEREEFSNNFSFLWGNIDFSSIPSHIGKNVKDFTTYPFLTSLIMENIDVDLFRPSFGSGGVPNFIYNVGKKVPRDTKYSIMIPMHIDAKFSEIRWHLRDYPLPFIYVPPLDKTQSNQTCALNIHGDMVIAEDMIQSDEELRAIFVPFVPSIIVENTDRYYSLLVPRTVTSIKFFSDLKLKVNSKDTTTVTFGGSYQPAIQHMMQCIDNISKPPLDPSMKIGFWDKVRYLFHGKVEISWPCNGKFDISLKASKSPYKLSGDSAGYSLGFHRNVVLTVNETDDPKKLLSCRSEKLFFYMPNFFARPLLVWSKPSCEGIFIPSQDNSNLQESSSYYYLMDLDNVKTEKADIVKMYDQIIEKSAIKLTGGVEFNLGMAFERLMAPGSDNRSADFVEHYKIRLCNPIYVQDLSTHDSYTGFRSEFVHMSFSLISKNETAYNAMQLTPNIFNAFMKWWRTFSGNFPVRRGPLFTVQSVSPKFSEHLCTISYLADISPLFISHICHNTDYDKDMRKNFLKYVEFAGIKAKTGHFLMDLHQRKEVLTEYHQKLDIRKKVKKMKFHMGDLRLSEIDIRTMNATLKRLEYIEQRDDAVYNIFDNDMTWFDPSDYKEAYFINPYNYLPVVNVHPLLYAPTFVYEKRAAYGDKFQINSETLKPIVPFSDSVSHSCVLGDEIKMATSTIDSRMATINTFISKTKSHLKHETDPAKKENFERILADATKVSTNIDDLLDDLETLYSKFHQKKLNDHTYKIKGIQELEKYVSESDLVTYENRYYIFNMLLKLNRIVRDDLFKFKYFFEISSKFLSLSSRKALNKFESIISHKISSEWKPGIQASSGNNSNGPTKHTFEMSENEDEALESILNMFNNCMSNINTDMSYEIHKNHFVQFVIPQIQVTCDKQAESCVIITSPNIMTKTISFEEKENENMYFEDIFLKRTGVLLTKMNVYMFNKKDYKHKYGLFFDTNSYGQQKGSEWPPWLGMEHTFEASKLAKQSLIKNFNLMYKTQSVLPFSNVYDMVKRSFDDRSTILMPKINISMTSKDYSMLLGMVKRLVLFESVEETELARKIEKVALGYDIDNIPNLYLMLRSLCQNEQKLKKIEKELLFKRELLDDAGSADLANIYGERMNHLLKLYMLMKVLESDNTWKVSDDDRKSLFDVIVNEVIVHLLNDDQSPFLDIAVAKLSFSRQTLASGFNTNQVTVSMFQVFNLEDVRYHNLVGPYFPPDQKCKIASALKTTQSNNTTISAGEDNALIKIVWEMEKPVGGIKIVNNVETNLKGLTLKLEDATLGKITQWLDSGSPMTGDTTGPLRATDSSSSESDDESLVDLITPMDTADAIQEQLAQFTQRTVDLDEMVKRSSDYIIVDDMLLNSFKLCVSYKGKGTRRLIDVSDFLFTFPRLVVKNQILRMIDFLRVLRRVLVRVLIGHTGKFLSTKLKKRRKHDIKLAPGHSLKQLTNYSSYTEVEDLTQQRQTS